MRAPLLAAAVALSGLAASQPQSLHVLRVSPTSPAEPTAIVAVTFDRPVAGSLDGTVDPRTIFAIAPAVDGKVEWRDPITLRFTPAAPLAAGSSYVVTIAVGFQAMDGSRLARPYRFGFRVGGPRVLTGGPVDAPWGSRWLKPDAQFELITSGPADLALASRLAFLELDNTCNAPTVVHLNAVTQRPITDKDGPRYQYAGGYGRSSQAQALRRVIRLVPERALPNACTGRFVAPGSLDTTSSEPNRTWSFATFGPLTASVRCTSDPLCPGGYAVVTFSNPVRGSEVRRAVTLSATTPYTLSDTSAEQAEWVLETPLRARSGYTVTVDSTLRDVFAQRLPRRQVLTLSTTGYEPSLDYPTGSMLVERNGFRTVAVKHVNTDTLFVTLAPVPQSLEARVLATPEWNMADAWTAVAAGATTRALAVTGPHDAPLVSAVKLPAYNAARPDAPTLTLMRIAQSRDDTTERRRQVALVQVTDLGVAVRMGAEEGVVWVTTVHDGLACPRATVTLYDRRGRVRATGTTDAQGLVRFTDLPPDTSGTEQARRFGAGFDGYVAVTLASDRAVVPLTSYAWELSPWRFNVSGADPRARIPAAAAVFTERGIYRPGETVHAKAIVRTGSLGALRVPSRGDSLHWVFYDREDGTLRDTTVAVSGFGTAEQALPVAADLPLGTYRVGVALRRAGEWTELATAYYRIAEYRPPEFLVSIAADTGPHFAGDTLTGTVEARYLFGAPMARAAVSWEVRQSPLSPWALDIPGTDGWYLGESGWWYEDDDEGPGARVVASGTDTLDATGHLALRVPAGEAQKGRGARVAIAATVTDVNRQTVTATTSTTVHPAAFYVAARPLGLDYFWTAGQPVEIAVAAVAPDGRRVPGVAVHGAIVRREWHRVQREREGLDEQVGEWVPDTVSRCDLVTTADSVPCRFTPAQGGSYVVAFRATDGAGRPASTSFYRWATGAGWVPWGDETQFKMDVIPDRTRYDVGDTATVLFASPFTDAEAWVTVEREGIIQQRRIRITSGSTSIKLPLTEAFVPNAYVSIVVARGRSAPGGSIGDPGRPTIRVGYAQLLVTPRVKRLQVAVEPAAAEYRPGDSARVRLHVRDAGGAGRRSEVTLWAVDEGVLSLTGYRTPDPVALIYEPRGVAMRLASDLVSVAAQVLDSEGISIKGDQAPGGGGGLEAGDVLRSRFASTAFFLGSVVTDSAGEAVAAAKLPDNLTTFRVMAVAVTAGDRYGSGESSLLVTRPLLARPALPRFLRRDDAFVAGVVVNQRAGQTPTVTVTARARGTALGDSSVKTATLAAGRGTEVRFAFRDTTTDTAVFRFDVAGAGDSDAVLTRLPVRPSHAPRAHTVAGVLLGRATADLALPGDIDPERSELVLGLGATPLAVVGGMYRWLSVYPYDCTEQVSDELLAVVALVRGGDAGRSYAPADALQQIAEGVAALSRRQRDDGGIGLWSADDWTTPWLSAYAGEALLAARRAGVSVRDSVVAALATYLQRSLHQRQRPQGPLYRWFGDLKIRLAENVAAADYLSRLGHPDVAAENELLRVAPQMAWEDRVRLAEIVARRGAVDAGRALLAPIWAGVRVEGRRAVLSDSTRRSFYFWSPRRPAARLLSATLAVDSASPLIGPLVETVVEQGRAASAWWNTQDYGAAVEALADFDARQRRAAERGFTVTGPGGAVVFHSDGGQVAPAALTRNLAGLLADGPDGAKRLSLDLAAPGADSTVPLFYYVTVSEVPTQRPLNPDQQGIAVERWYEDYATGRPITSATEGALVRVRLRITLPAERRFLALEDPLPAGLEAVDLSLRTTGLPGPGANPEPAAGEGEDEEQQDQGGYLYDWYYGSWDAGWWSPFDHREMRDDRVVYVATYLWRGAYTATYVARATTPGVFVRPPAHAEEMYNPAVQGRSDGGVFTVTRKTP
ncbi:MAG TPA: MG2 domain-containing protein [Gemmatimonadales bacterium]|nr:MG2 domain-containing protein [Gemmatimonadales bacterium]